MAHQTGIEPSDELMDMFAKALKGQLRFLQIVIENETLVSRESQAPNDTWENDLDPMLQPLLTEKDPCYILYRLDDRNSQQNHLWVFMTYIPDWAVVKEKMLYAATKATVRKNFSSGLIDNDIAATSKDELSLEGYRKFLEAKQAPPPLTDAEREQQDNDEGHTDIGTSTRQSHLHGITFPMSDAVVEAIQALSRNEFDYVQLSVDVKKETINLETTEVAVEPNSLPQLVPDTSPRYHLYRFKHRYEGDDLEPLVFVYSCPGFKSSVRERMLYSSSKEPVVSSIEQDFKIPIAKKLEISGGDELGLDALMEELHPQTTAYRPKFAKPQGPKGRRGPRQNKN